MENQIYLNILISFIISASISYFYIRKFNVQFIIYFLLIFLISFVILFCLGPNNIESFQISESCDEERSEDFYKYLGNWKFTNYDDQNMLIDNSYDYYLSIVKFPNEDLKAVISKLNPDDSNPYNKESDQQCPKGVAITEIKIVPNIKENMFYLSNVICSRDVENSEENIEEESNGLIIFKNVGPITQDLIGLLPDKKPSIIGSLFTGFTGDYENLNGKISFSQRNNGTYVYDLLEKVNDFPYDQQILDLLNNSNNNNSNTFMETIDEVQDEINNNIKQEILNNEENSDLSYSSMEEGNEEENKQEEELNLQEEHIKKSIEESEESENLEESEEESKEKSNSNNNLLNRMISGNNNQFNPGIGVGISPVNIYINGEKTSVDNFKKNKENSDKHDSDCKKRDDNNDSYYKKASRIYNNSDWIYDKKGWCSDNDENYNYNNDHLLPNKNSVVNKIPQILNNSINSKKNKNNTEPCPLDVNKPWSQYKTGDDNDNNELLPEGFNL